MAVNPGGGRQQGRGPRPSPRTASTLTVNPAELLYPMVLKYLTIEIMGKAEPVHISSKKIIEDLVERSVAVESNAMAAQSRRDIYTLVGLRRYTPPAAAWAAN